MRSLIAILVLLLLLLQYKLWFGDGGVIQVQQMNAAIEKQKEENETLKERNRALEAEVKDLKQGTDAVEERARTELGMIKDGETFYQVIDK